MAAVVREEVAAWPGRQVAIFTRQETGTCTETQEMAGKSTRMEIGTILKNRRFKRLVREHKACAQARVQLRVRRRRVLIRNGRTGNVAQCRAGISKISSAPVGLAVGAHALVAAIGAADAGVNHKIQVL